MLPLQQSAQDRAFESRSRPCSRQLANNPCRLPFFLPTEVDAAEIEAAIDSVRRLRQRLKVLRAAVEWLTVGLQTSDRRALVGQVGGADRHAHMLGKGIGDIEVGEEGGGCLLLVVVGAVYHEEDGVTGGAARTRRGVA